MAWDLYMWALVMMSLSIMQPKSNFPGSASQRATRLTPSFDTRLPPLMPHTRKMASSSSRTGFSAWLITKFLCPLYPEGFSALSELPKKFISTASHLIRFQPPLLFVFENMEIVFRQVPLEFKHVFSAESTPLQLANKPSSAVNIRILIWKFRLSWGVKTIGSSCDKHTILFTKVNDDIILINSRL